MFGISSDTMLGVEINEHRLLLAEVRKKGQEAVLQRAVQAAIPSEVMADGKVKQVDTLAELLRDTMRAAKITCKTANLVVPSQYVIIRQLQLPDLAPKQMRNLIDFELQNSIHLPFEDPIYDFVKLGLAERQPDALDLDEPGGGKKKAVTPVLEREVTLIASSRGAIDPVVEAARRAGLKPRSVDIRALALSRAHSRLNAVGEDGATMFVDVAESSTDIHIFQGDALKFTRNVPMALDNYGIDRECSKPLHVLEILEYFERNTDYRSYTSDLAYEIERSVNFFRYTLNNRDAQLQQVVLTGTLPKSGVFADFLQERMPETPVLAMPFADLLAARGSDVPLDSLYEYAIPIGLALKEVK